MVAKLQGLGSEWLVPPTGSEAVAICLVFLSLAVPTWARQTLTPNPPGRQDEIQGAQQNADFLEKSSKEAVTRGEL